jgi:hypothetical protein
MEWIELKLGANLGYSLAWGGMAKPIPPRWLILLLSFATLFGPFYCYDNPASNLNAVRRFAREIFETPTNFVPCLL